ncbi:Transcription factor [Penicillium griseofulvum]|uniref:Transcription factor n=1 Tax=Penicillium patulum TaxID=5078 RepID=A0A135LUX9_PENPA|nr:Transcription factor [Penicillium griseofulvum]KXG52778.1 Transcription factor [Penicillium griseofulvum]
MSRHVSNVELAKPRHLTAVENRLQLLESTLRRLFPTGEIDAITRSLLTDEVPTDQAPSTSDGPISQVSVDDPLPSDPMIWDDVPPNNSSPWETETNIPTGAELQDTNPSFNSLLTDPTHTPELLGTSDEESEFLANYFLHYHTLYPILHEDTFRLEYKGQIKASPHWQILANIVLAIGAWLTVHARDGLDNKYFAKAQNMVQNVHFTEKGDITLVQSLVLLGEFSKKQASPEQSGHYIGTAVRMAVFLSLHLEPISPYLNELDKEIRRRVWWSVYCAESCSAKIYGRPLLLPEEMLITVEPVSNIHESVSRPIPSLLLIC